MGLVGSTRRVSPYNEGIISRCELDKLIRCYLNRKPGTLATNLIIRQQRKTEKSKADLRTTEA